MGVSVDEDGAGGVLKRTDAAGEQRREESVRNAGERLAGGTESGAADVEVDDLGTLLRQVRQRRRPWNL